MGNYMDKYIFHPDTMPTANTPPQFDATYGFSEGRKPRVMIATDDEMRAAKLPRRKRDYCAHKLLDYERCRGEHYPFHYKCDHQLHEYQDCQYDDYVIRMKEYEREKRLLERQKRKKQAEAA